MSSAAVVALYFAIPRGLSSPTDFETAVATVVVVSLALVQESAASSEDTASSESVVAKTSSESASGCVSAVSLNTVFWTSGEPYMHLQSFTHGLRLETLALSSAVVTSGCICCIIGAILVTSTFTPSHMPIRPRLLVLQLSEHEWVCSQTFVMSSAIGLPCFVPHVSTNNTREVDDANRA